MLEFEVYGHPEPQGSTRAFIPKGWNRAIITANSPKLKPWRQEVTGAAINVMAGREPVTSAVEICVDFFFDRPKSVKKSVIHKTTKPDIDKLARAILDALTGVVFKDDSQVIRLSATKQFGIPERAVVRVSEI